MSAPPVPQRLLYGPDPFNFGELTVPPGTGPHPIVLVIHGGYWRAQYDLTYIRPLCAAIARGGYATWNLEYRRVGNEGGGWPGTFRDVATAADFLRTLASTYSLDLTRAIALGHSAGGHLALWLGARHRIPEGDPLWSANPLTLSGIVSIAGVSHLRLAYRWKLSNLAVCDLLGGDPDTVPEREHRGSPAAMLPLGVRQILLHGTEDDAVPYAMSAQYHTAALSAGDRAELISLIGVGHFEPVEPASHIWPTVLAAVQSLVPENPAGDKLQPGEDRAETS